MASGLCVPHKQAAHMAAPPEGQNIKKALANGEPSTHGAKRTFSGRQRALCAKAIIQTVRQVLTYLPHVAQIPAVHRLTRQS
jgi:hypothetical protein